MVAEAGCVFCRIVAGGEPARIVARFDGAVAFLNVVQSTGAVASQTVAHYVRAYAGFPSITRLPV